MRALRPLWILLVLALGLAAGAAPAAAGLTCGDIPDLTTLYFQKHLSFRNLDEEIQRRTAEGFLRRLDPQRALLLETERQRLEASLVNLFRETRTGDCTRLKQVQGELVARHREAEGFVRGFVGSPDYVVAEDARLVLDPDKRGNPRTPAERDALLRTLVHFQIANYLSSGSTLEEARQRLVHRYELQTRRAEELGRDDLYAAFLDAFASSLDPHSNYLSADVLEDFQIQMQLSLEGIGVALSERDGYAVVEQIIPGGAADQLGRLEPKDKIVAVAEEGETPVDVIDMALRDVVRLIRGKKGTRVELTVLRQTDGLERFRVSIERDKIDLEQQAAKLRVETVPVGERTLRLGVLDLPSFYGDRDPSKRQGSRDVAKLLEQAREQKLDGLLLDLSRNGGGLLEDAVRISGFFIREGGVVAIEGSGEKERVLRDPDDGVLWNGPMVVLVSRVSASASEILAGAMKDYRRAVVVGDDHTFGKGTVQSVFPLRPGLGALKVTTALFYRPGGTSTQHAGVATDVSIPSLFNTDDFGERNQPYSLPGRSIEPFLGPKANDDAPARHWRPVSDPLIHELARRSRERVERNEFFQKVEKELAKRNADEGVVRLADLIAEREEEAREPDADGAGVGSVGSDTAGVAVKGAEEEKPSPQVEEALRVLADLVLLES